MENQVAKTFITTCGHDCGGCCLLKVHVRDGKIIRIETADGDEPQLRACVRGRAYRQRVYTHDRLKYPMKRIGERGEGKFARIGWDEALDTVAKELIRVRDTYGNASILLLQGSGSRSTLHSPNAVAELLARFGGYTGTWGDPSYEGSLYASMATYGTITMANDRQDLLNSRLIILWGWNPASTVWDTNTMFTLLQAKEKGIRIITVDPRFTDTAAALADEWVSLRPGTDIAMLLAMAYVIVVNGYHDQAFLDACTVGFDKFRDYVMGIEDGIAKTPVWAEEITKVPSETIKRLAMEYARSKPAAFIPGWGPARSAMGEQFTRAGITLCALTGNIGKDGGFSGGFMVPLRLPFFGSRITSNPVDKTMPPRPNSLYKIRGAGNPTSARIHQVKVADAIFRGKGGGYPCDPKMAYIVASNFLNSRPDTNQGIASFKKLEFIVVQDQRLTPTAKFADILLPVTTCMEREDINTSWIGSPYYIYMQQAIDPMYEAKSDYHICIELATRLEVADYDSEMSDEARLRKLTEPNQYITDFDSFRKDGVLRAKSEKPFVAFAEEVKDPEGHPFPTISGRIELYSEQFAEKSNPNIPPVVKYMSLSEGYDDPLGNKYPLQLLTTHHKSTTHSGMERLPWLEEISPKYLWINSQDAATREITNGNEVIVFNDRGQVRIIAWVTERIIPGAVCIPQGSWSDIDEVGVDRGGCANVLTAAMHSPGGAWTTNTALVEVQKI